MAMTQYDEYTAPSGDDIVIYNEGARWAVGCWDPEGENRWFLYFDTESLAREEYERWRK